MTDNDAIATLIRGVRLFDGTALSGRTSLLMDAGRIVAIDPGLDAAGAHVVDGADGVLLPGFIDSHVHLHGPQNLEQFVRAGVTTVLDMACWPRELVDGLRNRRGLTDIRSAGVPATSAGSTHSKMPGRPEASVVNSAGEAERFVRDRLAEGSDYIKLIADVPGPDQETLNALVAAAQAHHVLTVAHAVTLVPYQMALAAGVAVVTHVPLDAVLDESTVTEMVQRSCVAVPTLTMMDAVATKFFGHGAEVVDDRNSTVADTAMPLGPGYHNAQHSVAMLHRAGVPILAGTDANTTPGVPANILHGASLHRELELLLRAGLTPTEALAAATSLPAKHFGLSDRGAIRPGLRADLVLLADDPLTDIANTRRVQRVWCAGIPADID